MSSENEASITSDKFLKTYNKLLHDALGNEVQLRGVNAGGWLIQEKWMNSTNAPDQKTMMDTFKSRFGAETRDELIAIYEDTYWSTSDFDNLQKLGANVVRLPFTYMNLVDDNRNLKTNAWTRIDWFIDNCSKRGIYVLLDMHGAFGSQNGMDHSGEINDGHQLYDNDDNKNKTLWLWGEIAKRYKGNATIAGYDILNEPGIKAGLTNKTQWDFYDKIYQQIRKIDADHIIIMEACWNPSDLPKPQTYGWENIIYEYHYYPWDSQKDLDGQKKFFDSKVTDVQKAGYNLPTFVGEFNAFDLMEAWQYAINTFNLNKWSWTVWSYKSKYAKSNWGIYNDTPSDVDIYNDTADVIKGKWLKVGSDNTTVNNSLYDIMKAGFK